uniref:Uncharacterized protein n=1 Tax=Coccolithus braarudii TaxID=221442 RepID=A0A7S0LBB2_9EUKA|mmetsp:Transcript_30717/g.66018  ORF Transcript_30717/g.66018 Transcript_30717/m.66018 type:complete len:572 (+) Transcript_30717:22-1737(+)
MRAPPTGTDELETFQPKAPGRRLPVHVGPARTYAEGGVFVRTYLLFRYLGNSAISRALPWAIIAAGYAVVLELTMSCNFWPSFCANSQGTPSPDASDKDFFFQHTYAYQAILSTTGLCLVFRLNQSLMRYWEARSSTQAMAAKWADALLMCLAFDEPADPPADHALAQEAAAFARSIVHLSSLLHAIAMHTLRGDTSFDSLRARTRPLHEQSRKKNLNGCGVLCGDTPSDVNERNPIGVLGGLSAAERVRLEASAERVHVALGWIHRLVVRRRKRGGMAQAEAPSISRIFQVLTDGSLWYSAALKVVDTPFPFPYAQLNTLTCFVNLGLLPFVIVDKISSIALSAVVAFFAVGLIFALNEVARELENPFTTVLGFWMGQENFHVPLMQRHFDERCLALAGGEPEAYAGCHLSLLGELLVEPDEADDEAAAEQYAAPGRCADESIYGGFIADALRSSLPFGGAHGVGSSTEGSRRSALEKLPDTQASQRVCFSEHPSSQRASVSSELSLDMDSRSYPCSHPSSQQARGGMSRKEDQKVSSSRETLEPGSAYQYARKEQSKIKIVANALRAIS